MGFIVGVIAVTIILVYSSHVQIHEIDRDTRKDIKIQERI